MGKHNKHQKRLRAEKAKTQLKKSKTKFLPKGQNVTDTTFKIKPIILPTQLENEHSKYSNEHVKDLVSKLNHSHDGTKIYVCEELLKILSNPCVPFIRNNLAAVLAKLGIYMQEKQPKARKEGLKVLDVVLKKYKNQINPHFHRLCLNLKCAMTDIDRNVQEDSILFFDVLLMNLPDLMAKSVNEILPNFLNLISKLKNDSDIKRTLTDNLQSKYTSLDWRFIVLSRLNAYLEIINFQKQLGTRKTVNNYPTIKIDDESRYGSVFFKNFPALWNPMETSPFWYSRKKGPDNSMKTSMSLACYMPNLIPLLYEFWLEGASEKTLNKGICFLSEDYSKLISCIIKVMHKLWIYVEESEELDDKKSLKTEKVEKLFQKLMENFPYHLMNESKPFKNTNSFVDAFRPDDSKLTEENLLTCFLYINLFPSKVIYDQNWSKIENYIIGLLQSGTCNEQLFNILRIIFISKIKVFEGKIDRLLNHVIKQFQIESDQRCRLKYLKLLLDIGAKDFVNKNQAYHKFVSELPLLFCQKSIDEETIIILSDFSRKNVCGYNAAFLENIFKILENLDSLKISNADSSTDAKKRILNTLYFLPKQNFHLNTSFKKKLSSEYIIYIEEIIKYI